jgi:hypothetical protein
MLRIAGAIVAGIVLAGSLTSHAEAGFFGLSKNLPVQEITAIKAPAILSPDEMFEAHAPAQACLAPLAAPFGMLVTQG